MFTGSRKSNCVREIEKLKKNRDDRRARQADKLAQRKEVKFVHVYTCTLYIYYTRHKHVVYMYMYMYMTLYISVVTVCWCWYRSMIPVTLSGSFSE